MKLAIALSACFIFMGGYALGIGLPAHAFMAVAFASGMFAIAKLIEPETKADDWKT